MTIGAVGSFISGASIPAFNYLFGRMIDTLNKDPAGFSNEVDQICIDYIIVAAANITAGFVQVDNHIFEWTSHCIANIDVIRSISGPWLVNVRHKSFVKDM